MNAPIHIGTSGWMYKDWGKTFYPVEMKKGFLTFLSQEFDTVEVNSSFYHLPLATTFTKWKNETPEGFVFAVKISRFITHEKKIKDVRKELVTFLQRAKRLKEKLGPILIQLPPWLRFDEALLKDFLGDLSHAVKRAKITARFALEPRHSSWMEAGDLVRKPLTKARVALVFPHSAKIPSFTPTKENVTTDFVYIRFHGPSEFAASLYGSRRLAPWAKRIRAWHKQGVGVYVYFNNDIHGHAIYDARTLKKLSKV